LTVTQKHATLSMCTITFILMKYIADCQSLWKKHLEQLNVTQGDIVFIQTGAWDFYQPRTSVDSTMEYGRKMLRKCMKYINERLFARGAKLVLVTTPPHGNLFRNSARGYRNNFVLTAFNAVVTSAAVNMSIPVYDEFGMILPRCEEHILGSHYIARFPKDNTIHGDVGIMSANEMLRNICVP